MRDKLRARGYSVADVVVVQGDRKENLRLYGVHYSVGRVRAAMFNAAITWRPIELDQICRHLSVGLRTLERTGGLRR